MSQRKFPVVVRVVATDSEDSRVWEGERAYWGGSVDNRSCGKSCVDSERSGGTAVPSHHVQSVNEDRGSGGWPSSPTAARTNDITDSSRSGGVQSSQRNDQPRHSHAPTVREGESNSTPNRLRIAAAAPAERNGGLDEEPEMASNGEVPRKTRKRMKIAKRIFNLWSKLPLSKLKIVIGELFWRKVIEVVANSLSTALSLVADCDFLLLYQVMDS